jgi:hypothetical protein
MAYPLLYQLKSMAALPNVYGNTFTGHIYNKNYSILRLKFWTAVCRKNAYLGKFYTDPKFSYESCKLDDLHTNLENIAQTVLKYGIAVVPDFLSSDLYKNFCDYYLNIPSIQNYSNKYGQAVYVTGTTLNSANEACKKISSLVSKIGAELLGTTAHQRTKLELEDLTIEQDCIDVGDINTNFHSDRFCPTIKSYYYPEGVELGGAQFEFVPGSHLITDRFIDAYKNYYLKQSLSQTPRYPIQLESYLDSKPLSVVTGPNTLVIAATHGIHRRSPFNNGLQTSKKMNRKNVMTLFYSQQTKLNMLLK